MTLKYNSLEAFVPSGKDFRKSKELFLELGFQRRPGSQRLTPDLKITAVVLFCRITMIDFEIRILESKDVSLAKELIEMFGFDEESEHQIFSSDEYVQRMLEREDFHVIVALENGNLIGGLTAYEMKMFKRETTEMFLYEIEVAEDFRRKGIGKALIEFLKQICHEKEIIQMFVGTEKENFSARKLYTATGGIADENSVWFNYFFE